MSSEMLLRNAISTIANDGIEECRKEIEKAEYRCGLITEKDVFLNNFIWMGPPKEWEAFTPSATEIGKLYEEIAPQEEPARTLNTVVEGIKKRFPDADTAVGAVSALYKTSEWFGKHLSLCTHFDVHLMSSLWVRNLRSSSGSESADKLYIEDGNHRALVYAIRLIYGAEKEFRPVRVIWCKSWEHILCWAGDPEAGDSPPSALEEFFTASVK